MGDWRAAAACRGMNPDVFHPAKDDQAAIDAALAVCDVCPVRPLCLRHALEENETRGIWGGQTERQRDRLRLKMNERAS
jgi:WhiB family redox-sensing transcriptional regulator